MLVTTDAQRTMSTYLGASSLIGPDDVDADLVARAKVVFCEGYLWDLPEAKAALVKAMDVAAASDGKVAFVAVGLVLRRAPSRPSSSTW